MSVTKLTISLPEDLAAYVDSLATESHKARSQIIADLLSERRARALYEVLAEGYKAMAEENSQFAEEAIHMAAEIWDEYPAVDWDKWVRDSEAARAKGK